MGASEKAEAVFHGAVSPVLVQQMTADIREAVRVQMLPPAALADVLIRKGWQPPVEDDLLLRSMSASGGVLDISIEAGGPTSEQALLLVSDACGEMLDANDATNYVEFTVSKRERPTYIVHVRRYGKPTPHALRQAAEAERDALRAQRDAVLALCDRADAKPVGDGRRQVNTVQIRALLAVTE